MEGEYNVTATATDSSGNTTPASNSVDFIVDKTAPGEETDAHNGGPDTLPYPVISIPEATDSLLTSDELSDGTIALVNVPNSTQPGDIVEVIVAPLTDEAAVIETQVPTTWDGISPIVVDLPLPAFPVDGPYEVTAVVIDQAGNASLPALPSTLRFRWMNRR